MNLPRACLLALAGLTLLLAGHAADDPAQCLALATYWESKAALVPT